MAYTSDSEFSLETRTQITNEVPPMDMFEQLNSVLQNDTWKWLLGWSTIDTDLEYKESDDPFDDNAPNKVVNGRIAKEYGPKPQKVWNPEKKIYETVEPKKNVRMEIDGALLPEHDLFLHEIYRYLDVVYPNHPDWVELLTHTEIVDAFESAAAQVDYQPDDRFFAIVAKNLSTLEREGADPAREELMLLLRNLKSNAYRRKFYGSSSGLKMIASGIYEKSAIFPVGKYLPLEAGFTKKVEEEKKELKELSEKLQKEVDTDVRKRTVDTLDPSYKRNFRIIDWHGTSKDIVKSELKSYSCKGYTVPGKEFAVIEYVQPKEPGAAVLPEDSVLLNVESNLSLEDSHVDSKDVIYTGPANPVMTSIRSELVDSKKPSFKVWKGDSIFSRNATRRLPVIYSKLIHLKGIETLQKIFDNGSESEKYVISSKDDNSFIEPFTKEDHDNLRGSTIQAFHNAFDLRDKTEEFEAINNPFARSTISLPLNQMIELYEDRPTLVRDEISGIYHLLPAKIKEAGVEDSKFPLAKKEYICTPDFSSILQVAGITLGRIEVEFLEQTDFHVYEKVSSAGFMDQEGHMVIPETIYGFVIKNQYGRRVLALGKLETTWQRTAAFTRCQTAALRIEYIPEEIPFELLLEIDSDAALLFKRMVEYRKQLDDYLPESNTYQKIQKAIDDIEEQLVDKQKNREFFYEEQKYKDAEGNEHTYYASLISDMSSLDSVCVVGWENGEDEVKFFPDRGTFVDFGAITKVDYGNVSLYPVVGSSAFSFPLATAGGDKWTQYSKYYKPCEESYVSVNNGKKVYVNAIADKYFDLERESCNEQYPSYFDEGLAKHLIGDMGDKNIKMSELEKFPLQIEAKSDLASKKDDAAYTLSFEGELNRRKFDSLTVGDGVTGSGIKANTYIVELGNFTVKLNNKIPHSGTYLYTFLCSVNSFPQDVSEDFANYKRQLLKYNSTSVSDPWQNGLYGSAAWPRVAQTYIDGLADPQNFKPYAKDGGSNFYQVMNYLYDHKLKNGKDLLFPSVVSLDREAFFELSINHLVNIRNRANQPVNLINVEWLDYIEENIDRATQAKDTISVGTNMMMQTDMSGYYTLVKGKKYTDDDIHLLFQTFNWKPDTIPAYAQIGSGGQSRRTWFKSVDDIPYPNVYGAAFFDENVGDSDKINAQLEQQEGQWRRRQVYSNSDNEGRDEEEEQLKNEHEVETLIAEVPLGEYDILKNYEVNHTRNDIISVSFEKQSYKDLSKDEKGAVVINNESIFTKDCFDKDTDEIEYFLDGDFTEIFPLPTPQGILPDTPEEVWYGPKEDVEDNEKPVNSYYMVKKGFSTTYPRNREKDPLRPNLIKKTDAKNFSLLIKADKWNLEASEIDMRRPLWKPFKFVYGGVISNHTLLGPAGKNQTYHPPIFEFDPSDYTGFPSIDTIAKRAVKTIQSTDDVEKGMKRIFDSGYIPVVRTVDISVEGTIASSTTHYYALMPLFGEASGKIVGYCRKLLSDTSLFNSSIDFSFYLPTQEPEFKIFLGTDEHVFIRLDEKTYPEVLLTQTGLNFVKERQSVFKLPRRCVTDGSYNISCTIDPHFLSEGIKYTDDETLEKDNKEKRCTFCVSKNPIYYDKINKSFYVNNPEILLPGSNPLELVPFNGKVALTFKEQKFYKETKNFVGAYKVTTEQKSLSPELKEIATIGPVEGINFNADGLSPTDRFLEMTPIELRSEYDKNLEPSMFSNYGTIDGELYGLTLDNELFISSKKSRKDLEQKNRNDLIMYTKIMGILPGQPIGDGNMALKKEFNVKTPIILKDGKDGYTDLQLIKPEIKTPLIPNELNKMPDEDALDTKFKYFKNYLIIEGNCDLQDGARFIHSTDTHFRDALNVLTAGDEVRGISQLSGGDSFLAHKVELLDESGAKITNGELAKYEHGKVIVAKNDGTIYYSDPISDLAAVSEVRLHKAEIFDTSTLGNSPKVLDIQFNAIENEWTAIYDTESLDSATEGVVRSSRLISWPEGETFESGKEKFTEVENVDSVILKRETKTLPVRGVPTKLIQVPEGENMIYVSQEDIAFKTFIEKTEKIQLFSLEAEGQKTYWSSSANFNDPDKNLTEEEFLSHNPKFISEQKDTMDGHEVTKKIYEYEEKHLVIEEGPSGVREAGQRLYKSHKELECYVADDDMYIKTRVPQYRISEDGTKAYLMPKKSKATHWVKITLPNAKDNTRFTLNSSTMDENYSNTSDRLEALRDGLLNEDAWRADAKKEKFTIGGATVDKATKEEIQKLTRNVILCDFNTFKAQKQDKENVWTLPAKYLPFDVNGVCCEAGGYTSKRYLDGDTENFVEEYNDYLYAITEYLIGGIDYEALKSSFVSTLSITDTSVILNLANGTSISASLDKVCTKKGGEDAMNWGTMVLPMFTTYTCHSNKARIRTNSQNGSRIKFKTSKGQIHSFEDLSSTVLERTFTIRNTNAAGQTTIFTGEFEALKDYKEKTNHYSEDTAKLFANNMGEHRLPFVAYSPDGTAMKLINVKALVESNPDMKGKNVVATSCMVFNNMCYITVEVDGQLYSKFLKVKVLDNGNLGDSDSDVPPTFGNFESKPSAGGSDEDSGNALIKPDEIADSTQKESSTTGEDIVYRKAAAELMYLTMKNIEIPFNLKVSSVGDFGFSLSNMISKDKTVKTVRLLMAIKTTKQIPDQTKYIDPTSLDDYVSDTGWKVPLVEEVKNPNTADKMYSFRETLFAENDTSVGYPSVEEDIHHRLYNYTVTTVGSGEDKQVFYNYETLRNKEGIEIKLCTADGLQIIDKEGMSRANRSFDNFHSLENLIEDFGTTPAIAPKVPVGDLAKTPLSLMNNDDDFEKAALDSDSKFTELRWDYSGPTVPYIKLKTPLNAEEHPEFFVYIDKAAYMFWMDNYTNPNYIKPLPNGKYDYGYNPEFEPAITSLKRIISYYEECYGPFNSYTNPTSWSERLVIGPNGFLFDQTLQFYIFSRERRFTTNLMIPYRAVDSDVKRITDTLLSKETDDPAVRELITDSAINSIYFPIKGYGDAMNATHTTWSEKDLPWMVDPEAFYLNTTLRNELGQEVYLADKSGNCILDSHGKKIPCCAPRFTSFRFMIKSIGRTISRKNSNLYKVYKIGKEFANISKIDKETSVISLIKPIDFGDEKLELGKEYYFKFRLLTIASVNAPTAHKNDPEYFTEVSKDEIAKFPPDRVYFESDGLPPPPVVVNGITYNAENSRYFYEEKYTNGNDKMIYLCDINGNLVRPTVDEDTGKIYFTERLDTKGDGDCSMSISIEKDLRFCPRKPIFNTCEDWLKNDFYVEGQEKNPFWQTLKIYPKYNESTKMFTPETEMISYAKYANRMTEVMVPDSDVYFKVHKATYRKEFAGNVTSIPDYPYVDLSTGEIRFVAEMPDEKYKEIETLVKYGITYINTFSSGKTEYININSPKSDISLSNVWTKDGCENVDAFLKCDYSVNSKEDLADPRNKDSGIQQVTEFALLDKDRNIIAYAIFPAIEYRTERQHLSFTSFISHTNLVPDEQND